MWQDLDPSSTALNDRTREFGFWMGAIGLVVSALIYLSIALSGELTLHYKISSPLYALFFGVMLISAYCNYRIKYFTNLSVACLFAVFWFSSYVEAYLDHLTFISTPLVLFVPMLLMMALNHKSVFALSLFQFGLVLHYTHQFGTMHYGADLPREEQFYLSLSFAVLSTIAVLAVGLVSMQRERTDKRLKTLVNEQSKLALTDPLTGLLNRRAFMEQLNARWVDGSPFVLAFIDLDNFKPLNDELGHAAGDVALCRISERLKSSALVSLVARLGGDEFAIVIENKASCAQIFSLVEQLHAEITQPIDWQNGQVSVGASIGYAIAHEDAESLPTLLRTSDAAMRRAKYSPQKVSRFEPTIDTTFMTSSKLELELPKALENGNIRAALQPIWDAKWQKVVSYELLARWVDSDFLNDPMPDAFIAVAEKLGVLNDLLWVTLDDALSHADLNDASLSINVSPAQLQSQSFLSVLVKKIQSHQVLPEQITLEITEQIAFRNLDKNITLLNQARQLGFGIALDDFGTGYSSLSMLAQLPITKLKIDKSFIDDSSEDGSDRKTRILRSAILLTHELGITCCVEGIENTKQLEQVAALGAQEVQGYLLGRPTLVTQYDFDMAKRA